MRTQAVLYSCATHASFMARVACGPSKAPATQPCPKCGVECARGRNKRGNVSVTDACKRRLREFCVSNNIAMSKFVEHLVADVGVK